MREAVGGALLYYLVIPIILSFIVFIAFIMRYASAYRAANFIVTQIESCQGYSNCASDWYANPNNLAIVSTKYHYKGKVITECENITSSTVAYDVTLYVDFDLPLAGKFTAFTVKSQTKSMHNKACPQTAIVKTVK